MPVSNDESKYQKSILNIYQILKYQGYEELCSKIKDLMRSKTNNLDDYDQKNLKTKFILKTRYL